MTDRDLCVTCVSVCAVCAVDRLCHRPTPLTVTCVCVCAASAAALPEVLRSHILSRPELYHQVLTYQPVWLESLHRELRQSGVKLSVAQLMDFLDEQVTGRGLRSCRLPGVTQINGVD